MPHKTREIFGSQFELLAACQRVASACFGSYQPPSADEVIADVRGLRHAREHWEPSVCERFEPWESKVYALICETLRLVESDPVWSLDVRLYPQDHS